MDFGTALLMGSSLFSGFSAYRSSSARADSLERQGTILYQEAQRDANIIREEGERFAATQSLQFISNGFELTGSALITLEQTRKYADTEATATERRGRAQYALAYEESSILRREGFASIVSGVLGAGAAYYSPKKPLVNFFSGRSTVSPTQSNPFTPSILGNPYAAPVPSGTFTAPMALSKKASTAVNNFGVGMNLAQFNGKIK